MPFYGTGLGKQKITLCFASYPSRVGNWGVPQFCFAELLRSLANGFARITLTIWLLCLSLLSTCSWCGERIPWLALWLSLLSTCSCCVVSASLDWLYDSLSSPPVAVCGERITWLALWLSLLSTCSWCVVSAYTWLALWLLSSPPVAGVWRAHTLDWLYALSPLHL